MIDTDRSSARIIEHNNRLGEKEIQTHHDSLGIHRNPSKWDSDFHARPRIPFLIPYQKLLVFGDFLVPFLIFVES